MVIENPIIAGQYPHAHEERRTARTDMWGSFRHPDFRGARHTASNHSAHASYEVSSWIHPRWPDLTQPSWCSDVDHPNGHDVVCEDIEYFWCTGKRAVEPGDGYFLKSGDGVSHCRTQEWRGRYGVILVRSWCRIGAKRPRSHSRNKKSWAPRRSITRRVRRLERSSMQQMIAHEPDNQEPLKFVASRTS